MNKNSIFSWIKTTTTTTATDKNEIKCFVLLTFKLITMTISTNTNERRWGEIRLVEPHAYASDTVILLES